MMTVHDKMQLRGSRPDIIHPEKVTTAKRSAAFVTNIKYE